MLHQYSTPEIMVLGEQDGTAERRLKEALAVLLGLGATVTRAYLARVRFVKVYDELRRKAVDRALAEGIRAQRLKLQAAS